METFFIREIIVEKHRLTGKVDSNNHPLSRKASQHIKT